MRRGLVHIPAVKTQDKRHDRCPSRPGRTQENHVLLYAGQAQRLTVPKKKTALQARPHFLSQLHSSKKKICPARLFRWQVRI